MLYDNCDRRAATEVFEYTGVYLFSDLFQSYLIRSLQKYIYLYCDELKEVVVIGLTTRR